MSACGYPSESADVTNIVCELPEGHKGDHEALVATRWGNWIGDEPEQAEQAARPRAERELAEAAAELGRKCAAELLAKGYDENWLGI